jgi:atypical dual specificity phosphatase
MFVIREALEAYHCHMIFIHYTKIIIPTSEYKKVGITQLRLPTTDTTAPSKDDILKGIKFIQMFRTNNPKKNFFIHCKGGRGRAATMMCAWLMFSEEVDLKIAFKNLKSKRKVVSSAILNYTVLHELEREFATTTANNKNKRITRNTKSKEN